MITRDHEGKDEDDDGIGDDAADDDVVVTRILSSNGTSRWWEVQGYPIRLDATRWFFSTIWARMLCVCVCATFISIFICIDIHALEVQDTPANGL